MAASGMELIVEMPENINIQTILGTLKGAC
jgi:hypothetical protein